MNTDIIKNKFLNFFKKNKYIELSQSSLIPENDKSLLFTNSGMVQFKNVFLGVEKPQHNRITTVQTCVRLGGKHNDLENIGKTLHHNTSFEMLGNFGFGIVSKEEAINLSINFLLNELNLNKNKIYITVNKNDLETFNIWTSYVEKKQIIICDDLTNFWQMAETGPCGYCSEIFYNINNDNTDPNLLEIWNLVFITFNKQHGKLNSLTNINLDTGMGLERIASVMQNVFDSFKTDIYKEIITNIIHVLKLNITENNENVRIIADHIKTSILLLQENIIPSNDGRGYILKKLIRRAILKKIQLNTNEKLFSLTNIYEKFIKKKDDLIIIKNIIKNEEIKFENIIKNSKSFIKKITLKEKVISGQMLFKLYDTYGIPIDIIDNIAKESNIKLELKEFKNELDKNKIKNKKNNIHIKENISYIKNIPKTIFLGYENTIIKTNIISILKDNIEVQELNENEKGSIITLETTFYAEKGGQIGDSGTIENNANIFYVENTHELNNIFIHNGIMTQGTLKRTQDVYTKINLLKRKLITNNHSATHLLHSTLKNILGTHIKQAGSLITDEYLRFDFTHFSSLSKEEIKIIELAINDIILKNYEIITKFEENNNNNKTRTIIIGDNISKELCAGTHVKNTLEICLFKILKEYGIGNNVRRIEAITNYKIIDLLNKNENIIDNIANNLKTKKVDIEIKLEKILNKNKELEKENQKLLTKIIKNEIIINNITIEEDINLTHITEDIEKVQIKNITSNLENTILLYSKILINKTLIKIIVTDDLCLNAINIIDSFKNYFTCTSYGNNVVANGIINKEIKNNDLLKHIQLYLKNFNIKVRDKC